MNNVSFLRIRPCNSDNDLHLNSRIKEHTSSLLFLNDNLDLDKVHNYGFQTISRSPEINSYAWIFKHDNFEKYKNIDRKLLIYELSGIPEIDYEIISREKIPYAINDNINYLETLNTSSFESLNMKISMYVDTIDDALSYINLGVSDLWLRDWNNSDINTLAKNIDINLYERTVTSPVLSIQDAREILTKQKFTTYLESRDVRGYRRQKVQWAPGKDLPVPDSGSISYSFPSISKKSFISSILNSVEKGKDLSNEELFSLFQASGSQIDAIASFADEIREEVNGDNVSFVINRNINYTNQCYYKCGFCGFSKGPQSLSLREKPYSLEIQEVVQRTIHASKKGATEVCLQGGIHPEYTGKFYLDLVKEIRAELPDIHIHGFTPLEVWQGAETINLSVQDYLFLLKEAGLNTLPGTAAEILDDRIREHLCPDKITSSQWGFVMEQAHSIGIKSTATIMFGHIDDVKSWVNHFSYVRDIQKRTKGFTEFVPLPFVHMGAPIYNLGRSMPGPVWDEIVLIHSLARIYFMGYIDNIQASWVKLGLSGVEKLLKSGVNDLGGTLMNESISRASGADHGQEIEKDQFYDFIVKQGKTPVLRNTLYNEMKNLTEIKS